MADGSATMLDLYVVGGGINGAGIANDAAGRGLRVALCEQGDLAGATSSASSKLIHGGLRYLEHREFRLVREALHEREVLLTKAPHIVAPMRFVLPHRTHLRPAWKVRAGLFLYDHLGKRDSLPGSRGVRLDPGPLRAEIRRGFEYSDCWVDDARLVVLNALQAQAQGAEIRVRTRCIAAHQEDTHWRLTLEDRDTGKRHVRRARVLVNATGPWVESFIRDQTHRQPRHRVRMIQGSHLVVPRLNPDARAYILQHHDGRIVFVLPYQEDFSLIGTTDRRVSGDPAEVGTEEGDIDYLLDAVNHYFRRRLERHDVVATFSGVRPLCADESTEPSAMSRDYTLDLDEAGAPLLTVYGGKITTYRRLAEAALARLTEHFPSMGPTWTAEAPLPGGDIVSRERFRQRLADDFPFLDDTTRDRYVASYGSLCLRFLNGRHRPEALGEAFGAGLTAAEVDYLIDREWARDTDDILWRRTKLGLRLTPAEVAGLERYLSKRRNRRAA